MFKKISLGLLSLAIASTSFAGTLVKDLYRSGNSTTPRMDNVRTTDVTIFQQGGVDWVRGKQGGVSTTSVLPTDQKNWWKVPKGTVVSNDIYVVNDHDNHWAWAPARNMPLADFVRLMEATNSKFTKLK